MEGYVSENRWVDLSGLPRWGNGSRIKWQDSVGYIIPFKHDDVEGNINIVGFSRYKNRAYLMITIKDYVPMPIKVDYQVLSHGDLHKLVGNKIIDKAPSLVKYLVNSNDAYAYTYQSSKKVDVKCPICGYTNSIKVSNLYDSGFICPMCSDSISLPNKMMFNILTQLNIPFIREVSRVHFPWMKKFTYDFYINIEGKNILIEMDGGFHKFSQQQINDIIKNQLAKDNLFDLIRIDCDYYNTDSFVYVQNNIKNSDLSKILNLNNIDWDVCKQYTCTSIIPRACSMWNDGYSVGEIMQELQLSKTSVRKYLKKGFELGLCLSYNAQVSNVRGAFQMSKYVAIIDNNNHIQYVFRNVTELESKSTALFGVILNKRMVQDVCRGALKKYRGMIFKYITKEEYKQYKIINNNEVVKEVAI